MSQNPCFSAMKQNMVNRLPLKFAKKSSICYQSPSFGDYLKPTFPPIGFPPKKKLTLDGTHEFQIMFVGKWITFLISQTEQKGLIENRPFLASFQITLLLSSLLNVFISKWQCGEKGLNNVQLVIIKVLGETRNPMTPPLLSLPINSLPKPPLTNLTWAHTHMHRYSVHTHSHTHIIESPFILN